MRRLPLAAALAVCFLISCSGGSSVPNASGSNSSSGSSSQGGPALVKGVSSSGPFFYVAYPLQIGAYNEATNAFVSLTPITVCPRGYSLTDLALSYDNLTLYASTNFQQVLEFSTATNTASGLFSTAPYDVHLEGTGSPTQPLIYGDPVLNGAIQDFLAVYSESGQLIRTLPNVVYSAWSFSADGSELYTVGPGPSQTQQDIEVFATSSGVLLRSFPAPANMGISALSFDSADNDIYLAGDFYSSPYFGHPIEALSATNGNVVASIPVASTFFSGSAAYVPTIQRVYIIDQRNSAIDVVDTSTNSLSKVIQLFNPSELQSIAASRDGAHIYVTGFRAGIVYAIDTASNTVVAKILPPNPEEVGTPLFVVAQ